MVALEITIKILIYNNQVHIIAKLILVVYTKFLISPSPCFVL